MEDVYHYTRSPAWEELVSSAQQWILFFSLSPILLRVREASATEKGDASLRSNSEFPRVFCTLWRCFVLRNVARFPPRCCCDLRGPKPLSLHGVFMLLFMSNNKVKCTNNAIPRTFWTFRVNVYYKTSTKGRTFLNLMGYNLMKIP